MVVLEAETLVWDPLKFIVLSFSAFVLPNASKTSLRKQSANRELPSKLVTDLFTVRGAGLAQGATYTGIEQNFMGSIRWQHSGGRLLAMARPSEVPGGAFVFFDSIPKLQVNTV